MTDAEQFICACGNPKEPWAHICYDCGQQERREDNALEREKQEREEEP